MSAIGAVVALAVIVPSTASAQNAEARPADASATTAATTASLAPKPSVLGDDYCAKVRARAGSDAALLYAPSVRVEGVKLPTALQSGGQLDATSVGASYQFRAGLTISASNVYKGTRVEQAADADCVAHASAVTAQELLMRAPDLGRLGALRDEIAFLDQQRSAWELLESNAAERVEAKNATLIELEDVRSRTTTLARQRAQLRGELQRLEATDFDGMRLALPALIQSIERSQMAFEKALVKVRAVDPWEINVTGGYIPPIIDGTKSDFFGVIQISYNIGGPWHTSRDDRYITAREQEVRTARYELPHQLAVLREHVRSAISQAREELVVVDKRILTLVSDRGALEHSEASMAPHALAMLDLELITTRADQVFLKGLIRELSRMENKE